MSDDELDSCVDLLAGHAAAASGGGLMESETTPEDAMPPDFSRASTTSEPRPGTRSLAPEAVAWHTWLLTRTGRTASGCSHSPQPASPPGPNPMVTEEVSALGAAFDAVTAIEWQRLWLATQRRSWRSLAVVPVGGGIPTARVARALAEVGSGHLGAGMMVTDATNVTLEWLRASTESLTMRRGGVDRVLIALGPVLERPASLALAQVADASILCLVLNESSISEAARTIEEVGRERFLGSVILRPDKDKMELP